MPDKDLGGFVYEMTHLVQFVLRPRAGQGGIARMVEVLGQGMDECDEVTFRGEPAVRVGLWVTCWHRAARSVARDRLASLMRGVPYEVLESRLVPLRESGEGLGPEVHRHRGLQPSRWNLFQRLAKDFGLLDRQHSIKAQAWRPGGVWLGEFMDSATTEVGFTDLADDEARSSLGVDTRPVENVRTPRDWAKALVCVLAIVAAVLLGVVAPSSWLRSVPFWWALALPLLGLSLMVGQIIDPAPERTRVAKLLEGLVLVGGGLALGCRMRDFEWDAWLVPVALGMCLLVAGWLLVLRRHEGRRVLEFSLLVLPLIVPLALAMGGLYWRMLVEKFGVPGGAVDPDWSQRLVLAWPFVTFVCGLLFVLGGVYGWLKFFGLPDLRRAEVGVIATVLSVVLALSAWIAATQNVERWAVRERKSLAGGARPSSEVAESLQWVCVEGDPGQPRGRVGGPPIVFRGQPVLWLLTTDGRVWLWDPTGFDPEHPERTTASGYPDDVLNLTWATVRDNRATCG